MKTKLNERLISFRPEFQNLVKQLLMHDKYGVVEMQTDEYGEPLHVIVDGTLYKVRDAWQRQSLFEHISNIIVAVNMVEDKFTSFEKIPYQVDPFIYKYHPRWIMLRGRIPENSFGSQFEKAPEVKTVKQWQQFFWYSIGVKALEIPNISEEETMTMSEFMKTIPISILLTQEAFQKRMILRFLRANEIDEDIAVKLKTCAESLTEPVTGEFLDRSIDISNRAMAEIDYKGYITARKKTESFYCKPYLTAFTRTIEIQRSQKDRHVEFGEADDGFLVLKFRHRLYDLRHKNALERLSKDMQNYVRKLRRFS